MPASVPRREPTLLETEIDGEAIVFHPRSKRAHLLNPTATLIWRFCDGGHDIDQVVGALAQTFAVGHDRLHADVTTTVAHLQRDGLLVDGIGPAVEGPGPRLGAPPDQPPLGEGAHTTSTFMVVGRRIAFRVADDHLVRLLDWYFAPLAVAGDAGDVYDIATQRDPDGVVRYDACLDEEMPLSGARADALAPGLLNRMNRAAGMGRPGLPVLHASAVQAGGVVAAFPAEPGAGKSTLVMSLLQEGLGYVTDEAIGLEPGTLATRSYPKRIALKEGSWSLFPGLEPEVPDEFVSMAPSWQWDVDPRAVDPGALRYRDTPGRLALVVFPKHVPGAPVEVQRLGSTGALLALMANTFNLVVAGQPGLDALSAVATAVPCYRMAYGDSTAGRRTVLDLLAEHGFPPPTRARSARDRSDLR